MCLSYITSRTPEPNGIGWKEFLNSSEFRNRWRTLSCAYRQDTSLVIGRWEVAEYNCPLICEDTGEKYSSGFHIWKKSRKKASLPIFGIVIRKVKYANAIIEGQQYGEDAVVACMVYIIPTWFERIRHFFTGRY